MLRSGGYKVVVLFGWVCPVWDFGYWKTRRGRYWYAARRTRFVDQDDEESEDNQQQEQDTLPLSGPALVPVPDPVVSKANKHSAHLDLRLRNLQLLYCTLRLCRRHLHVILDRIQHCSLLDDQI